jgi:SHS2 domain-containing protein
VFRFLDHTGDIALELRAPSLAGLFAEALSGFTSVLTDLHSVRPLLTRRVEVEAAEPDTLLVEWLSEVLYLFEVPRLVFRSAEVSVETAPGRARLVAELHGETYDPERHPPKLLVKAVTYHALELREEAGGFVARLVLDI